MCFDFAFRKSFDIILTGGRGERLTNIKHIG